MTVLALSVILLAGTAWTLAPLWQQQGDMPHAPNDADELLYRHRQLLLALQDLDFERQTGKLSDLDHQDMRRRLQSEAVTVLQELERLRTPAPEEPEPAAGREA